MKTLDHVEDTAGVAATSPMPWEQFKRLFNEA
jgi:hypothetical protein